METNSDETRIVREYVKEVVEIDGITVVRKVIEMECKLCKWFPFGIWIGTWAWILGSTALIGWLFS